MASCQKLSEKEASTMNTMFNSYRMEESHMNRVKDSKSMLLGGLSSDDEEVKDSGKNAKKVNKARPLQILHKERGGNDQEDEVGSTAGALKTTKSLKEDDIKSLKGEDLNVAFIKCTKMASILSQQKLQLKTLEKQLKGSM